jgi:hypothetical protein
MFSTKNLKKWFKVRATKATTTEEVKHSSDGSMVSTDTVGPMQECSSHLLELDWRKGFSPLGGDETQYTGCIVCDDLLRDKCEVSCLVRLHEEECGSGRVCVKRQLKGLDWRPNAAKFKQSTGICVWVCS